MSDAEAEGEGQPGILSVTVGDLKLTRDTELVGEMSPYCTLTHKTKKLKTKVRNNCGKEVTFGDEFTFDINSPGEEIFVRVWDQDLLSSDPVGFVKVKASSLMINDGTTDTFTIYYENESAGFLTLTSVWAPEGGTEHEKLQAQFEEQTARLEAELEEAKEKAAEMEARQAEIQAKLEEQAAALAAKEAELEALKAQGNSQAAQQQEEALKQEKMQEAKLKAELQASQNAQQALMNPNGAGYLSTGFNHGVGMMPMQQMMPQMQQMGLHTMIHQQAMMGGMMQMQQMQAQQQMMMGGMGMGMGMPGMQMGGMMPGMGMGMNMMQSSSTTTTTTTSSSSMMMGGMGMMHQNPYGMQPGMQPYQPPKPQTYCGAGHVTEWKNDCPYPGAEGITCDDCSRDIAMAYWFHHCASCQSDYCQNCGKARTR